MTFGSTFNQLEYDYSESMLEVLDIPDLRRHLAPISIARYHRMIDLGVFDDWEVELIDGVLVEKFSKSELHIFLVQYLFQELAKVCPNADYLVRKEDPITIGDSEPEPDISVVEGTLLDYRKKKPETARLVIEVAINSAALDRAKACDYARAGIPEFFLIEPIKEMTTIFRNPEEGGYTDIAQIKADQIINSDSIKGFSFCLKDLLED